MSFKVPTYRELPIRKDAPAGSAWGVFDRDGNKDVHGTLNFITKDRVVDAKKEIQTGESVVVNLPLHLPHGGAGARIECEHTWLPRGHGLSSCDDELKLNTQSSSQWDGLLHWAHQERGEYYNGTKFADVIDHRTDLRLGIQSVSERGGIVARGVLLDFVRYAKAKGIEYDIMTNYAISLDHIKDMIVDEDVELRPGDILLIRCGLSRWIRASTPDSQGPTKGFTHIGVDPTPELFEWIWDNNLAAVGGDMLAFEAIPPPGGPKMTFPPPPGTVLLPLHHACLAGWGMMIGELLDLEALAALAEKNRRWSFFMTICPLNVEGGAATLSNTLAVF